MYFFLSCHLDYLNCDFVWSASSKDSRLIVKEQISRCLRLFGKMFRNMKMCHNITKFVKLLVSKLIVFLFKKLWNHFVFTSNIQRI